jgi:hypothetical protein
MDIWSLTLTAYSGKEAERDPDFLHEAPKKFACAAFRRKAA